MTKKQNKFAFLLSLSLIVLSACTGGKSANDNTLHLSMIADAKGFDPAEVGDFYTAMAVSHVYEGLVEYEYLKRPHELKPLLIESMPQISKDGLTYTFKLLKGVKFMDHSVFEGGKGREVKAQDFIYSWLRIADPKLNSQNFWIFDGHIVGLNEWREAQKKAEKVDYAAAVEGLKAVDDYTIQIKLKHKYPQLLFVLAMPPASVVAREAVEKLGKDFVSTPVGTGPYKLAKWMRNSKISYERNPNWRGQTYPTEGEASDKALGHLEDAGKPIPFADKVDLHVFVESQPNWLNFMSGSTDYILIPKDNYSSAVDPATKEILPDLAAKGVRLQKTPQPDVVYNAFNLEDPVIKKGGPNLRKAIALAIDKRKQIELFRNGRAILAHSPIPPGLAGYDENFKNPYSEHNVEEAKKYLAKAGYPGGKGLPELQYETSQGADSRQMAEKIKSELAAIGINMKINVNQFSELSTKLNERKAQFWGIAWIADYPDAENFLQLLYGPNSAPGPNSSNMNNPEYNKLYEQVRGMTDSPERRKLIRRMQEIFVEELPWVAESHRSDYYLSHKWLKNFKWGYMGGAFSKWMRVDTAARAEGFKK